MYSVATSIALHRTWRFEKDNGFAEHIRLATGATHDTGRCSLELSSRVGHGGALRGPRASADGRGGGPHWPKVAHSGLRWPLVALTGPRWPSVAQGGPWWP